MKNIKSSIFVKTAAIILASIIMLVTITSGVGIAFMADAGCYTKSDAEVRENVISRIMSSKLHQVYYSFRNNDSLTYSFQDSNFYFTITDEDGNILGTNYNNEKTQFSASEHFSFDYIQNTSVYEEQAQIGTENFYENKTIIITGYLSEQLNYTDSFSNALKLLDIAEKYKYTAISFAAIGLILMIFLLVFLYCSAGYRSGKKEPQLNLLDKIPFDIYTAAFILAIICNILILENLYEAIDYLIAVPILLLVDFLVFLAYSMSFATRIKLKTLIKGTFIYKVSQFVAKCIIKLFRKVKFIFKNIPFIRKSVIIVLGISFFEFLMFGFYESDVIFSFWIIEKIILIPVILLILIALNNLKKGGERIADGDLDYHIDTSHMYLDFKDFGEKLNSINTGMSKAVDGKMKSERFKTELITNVSHDIKTPLTSIINYVDLIKKENPENENIKQYIDVLDRQSSRLKKLIEDLIEASKASTGNLSVSFTKCEVGVLLSQAIGEYDEKLKSNGLQAVLTQPDEPIEIMADGRHLWRVFDNLMNNICKYALPSTRVYLDLQKIDGKAVITFKNISKKALNITSEELMERFVRGDSSRNTEGSGLGLSIAKSLVELQNGNLQLLIDGDLFKVVLTF